jgi:dihydrofolate synthase/folylpolyglutamate synthase
MNHELRRILDKLNNLVDWERRDRSITAPRFDLCPTWDLLTRLGNPQKNFKSVHITGTKGKGSVCALIEAALHSAGINVARFSSPHVERITERITFGGEDISEPELADFLNRVWAVREQAVLDNSPAMHSTWFDVLTAAAFLAYSEYAVEWAVVEVGIGGRLDSTNTINSFVAVVTNVELEHTQILGRTRAAIAREKVGILKKGTTLVTGVPPESEAGGVLIEVAKSLDCPVVTLKSSAEMSLRDFNLAVAGAVLDVLGARRPGPRVLEYKSGRPVGRWLLTEMVISSAQLPGRMERLSVARGRSSPSEAEWMTIILDGAHVPFNLRAVLRDLTKADKPKEPCIVVISLGRDKDPAEMLSELRGFADYVVFTANASGPPQHEPSRMWAVAQKFGIPGEIVQEPCDAFRRAVDLTRDAGWLLVTGSLYLVGTIRPLIKNSAKSDLRNLESRSLGAALLSERSSE